MDFQLKALGHWSHLYSLSSLCDSMCFSRLWKQEQGSVRRGFIGRGESGVHSYSQKKKIKKPPRPNPDRNKSSEYQAHPSQEAEPPAPHQNNTSSHVLPDHLQMLQEMLLPSLPKEIISYTSQYFTLVILPCSLNYFYLTTSPLNTPWMPPPAINPLL